MARAWPGPNAARAALHYLDRSGTEIHVSLPDIYYSTPALRTLVEATDKRQAGAFACGLPPGKHRLVGQFSANIAPGGTDWFLALGAMELWSGALAEVTCEGGHKRAAVRYTLHLWDPYLFKDPNQPAPTEGCDFGGLNDCGLAKVFVLTGEIQRRWVFDCG
jgi:hypothetical protein